MNYTYILRCGDGSLYTGWTNNLEKRLEAHNAGRGGRYTRSRLPVKLVYYESFDTKNEAMRREAAIKKLTRQEKEKLNLDTISERPQYLVAFLLCLGKKMVFGGEKWC